MKVITAKFMLLSGLFGFISCSNEVPQRPASNLGLNDTVVKYDPSQASIYFVNKTPTLGAADEVSTLQVPNIQLSFDKATMAQILRCEADLELKTTTGDELAAIENGQYDFTSIEQARWIWNSAFGNNKCKLVGSNIAREKFQDLAAKPGDYYYLVNPCVSQNLSTTGKEGCSFKLIKSGAITGYSNSLTEDFLKASEELAATEGKLYAHFNNLKSYSELIKLRIESCESAFANEQARGKFMKGIISLAATAVGTVVGAYVGGPMGAIKGGELTLGIAQGLLGLQAPPVLNCPAVDQLKKQAQETMALIDPQVQEVIRVRTIMHQLESTYNDLDGSIANQTGKQE